jgi:hypothetical protein
MPRKESLPNTPAGGQQGATINNGTKRFHPERALQPRPPQEPHIALTKKIRRKRMGGISLFHECECEEVNYMLLHQSVQLFFVIVNFPRGK